MKIAHVAIATPNRCGLYETTHDLVEAVRAAGEDARIVDPAPTKYHPGSKDRGVPVEPLAWAAKADVLIDHSGLDHPALEKLQTPVVYINHGRPWSSFVGEHAGGAPVLSYWYTKNRNPRYKAVVTFWPEHVPYLEAIWTRKPVYTAPPPCNLTFWSPGDTPYDFEGKGGSPNVVIADMWRDDVDPFPSLAAFLAFGKRRPTAKLHVYGLPDERRGINVLLKTAQDRGQLGVAAGFSKGLRNAYRKADLVLSPHTIYTRTIREAMACGAQVVSGKDADPFDLDAIVRVMEDRLEHPQDTRREAERLFDPKLTAQRFLDAVQQRPVSMRVA